MSGPRRGYLVAVPAVLGLLLALHPTDPSKGEAVRDLGGQEGRWLTVHVGLLVMLPLLGLWLWLVLDNLTGPAATAARVGVVFFVAFYTAFDALVGVATGVLVREARQIGATGEAAQLVETWWRVPAPVWVFSTLGPVSWLLTAAAAALAHARARSGPLVTAGLAIAAPLFAFGHPTLAGPAAMVALVVAALALGRGTPK